MNSKEYLKATTIVELFDKFHIEGNKISMAEQAIQLLREMIQSYDSTSEISVADRV